MNVAQVAPAIPTMFHAVAHSVVGVGDSMAHVVKAVAKLVQQFFGLASSVGTTGGAVKELIGDGLAPRIRSRHEHKVSFFASTAKLVQDVLVKIREQRYHLLHGALYFVAGTLGTVLAVSRLGWIRLAAGTVVAMTQVRDAFFTLGNITALHYYSAQLKLLVQQLSACQDPVAKEELETQAHVNVLGIVSAASCILATALAVVSAPAAIVFILGTFGTVTGALPTVHSVIQWMNDLQNKSVAPIWG